MSGERSHNLRKCHGALSLELPVLIMVIFGFFLLPLADMLGLLVGYGLAETDTEYVAQEAAKCSTAAQLKSDLTAAASRFKSMVLVQLLKVKPVGGYLNSGANFYLVQTNIYTGKETYFEPDAWPAVVDQTSNIYELCIKSKFEIGPLLPLPWLQAMPGCNSPAEFNFAIFKPVEHLSDLVASEKPATMGGGATGITGNSVDWLGRVNLMTFFYPLDGTPCTMNGQNILAANNSFYVNASNPDWTDSSVYVHKGERMSLSVLNAWLAMGKGVPWDINGNMMMYWGSPIETDPVNHLAIGQLIMKIGVKGKPFYFSPGRSNMIASESGEVFFECNDISYADNSLTYQLRFFTTTN